MSNKNEQKFIGYAIKSADTWDQFEVMEFKPKKFEDDDLEIAITHCGVCGSDVHIITNGWGKTTFPLIVGHEIVGKVTRVGSNVKGFKVGDRAGVGAQISSCYKCRACKDDNENYCPDFVDTYNAKYPDGTVTMGGFSTAIRANQQYVFPIPDGLESKDAASMLCAGITVFSPLKRHGCGPGKKVGIIGIGGLGHYAILFAKALGAEVYAFSHSPGKYDDIKGLGADHIVDVSEKDFHNKHQREFDIIISTRDVSSDFPLADYLTMLYVEGAFVTAGLPDEPLPTISAFDLLPNAAKLCGTHIGSKKEIVEMLNLAAEKGIKPRVEELSMKEASKAVQGVKDNEVRYRYVLTQDLA